MLLFAVCLFVCVFVCLFVRSFVRLLLIVLLLFVITVDVACLFGVIATCTHGK